MSRKVPRNEEGGVISAWRDSDTRDTRDTEYCQSSPPAPGPQAEEARGELRLWVEAITSGGNTAAITEDRRSRARDGHETRILRPHTY